MKKTIYGMILILTLCVFFMQYSFKSNDVFASIVNAETKLENHYTLQLPHAILKQNDTFVLESVIDTLDTYQASMFVSKKIDQHYYKYVYVQDTSTYVKLFEMNEDEYASSQVGNGKYIETFNQDFAFTIYPLQQLFQDGFVLQGEVSVVFEDVQMKKQFIDTLNQLLDIDIKETQYYSGQPDFAWAMILTIIAFYFVIVLLVIYDLLSQFKRFAIYRLHGYSMYMIWKKYTLPVVLYECVLGILIYVVFSALLCRGYNGIVLSFLMEGILMVIILSFITLLLITICISCFHQMNVIDFLKNKRITSGFTGFNQVVFLVIILILTKLFLVFFDSGGILLTRLHNQKQWEVMQDFYVLPVVENVEDPTLFSSVQFIEKQKQLFVTYNALGSIYADFNEFVPERLHENSMAYVNCNYINQQIIFDEHGEEIQIEETQKEKVVLVPEGIEKSEVEIIAQVRSMYDITKGIQIQYYDSQSKFFTYNTQIQVNYSNYLQDIILVVLTNENGVGNEYDVVLGIANNPYKIKADLIHIQKTLQEIELSQYIETYITAYDEMATLRNNETIVFISVIVTLGILILLMYVMITQNINLFIARYTTHLCVETMCGYAFLRKYWQLIEVNVYTFLISILINICIGYDVVYMCLFYSVFIGVWWILFMRKCRSVEKASILKMIKGG